MEWSGHFGKSEESTKVDFGEVTCRDLSESRGTIESVEVQGYPEEPTFHAAVTTGGERVSLMFDNIYVFSSNDPFVIEGGSVTFDGQSGSVFLNSGGERVIDSDATLTGTVTCGR